MYLSRRDSQSLIYTARKINDSRISRAKVTLPSSKKKRQSCKKYVTDTEDEFSFYFCEAKHFSFIYYATQLCKISELTLLRSFLMQKKYEFVLNSYIFCVKNASF